MPVVYESLFLTGFFSPLTLLCITLVNFYHFSVLLNTTVGVADIAYVIHLSC